MFSQDSAYASVLFESRSGCSTGRVKSSLLKCSLRLSIATSYAHPKKFRGGRPSYDAQHLETVTTMLANGAGATAIAKVTGLTWQTIVRVRADPAEERTALAR